MFFINNQPSPHKIQSNSFTPHFYREFTVINLITIIMNHIRIERTSVPSSYQHMTRNDDDF